MDETEAFEQERPRLTRIAAQVLGDHAEAEDVVQQAWLRLHRNQTEIENLAGWLTTVTTRLCLDRLKAKTPFPVEDEALESATTAETTDDVLGDIVLADTVGVALQVVLDRLSPRERVAFVLHDSFGFDFPTVAAVLETTPAAARKLASRARGRIGQPSSEDALADWEVVDAFMGAAREGDFERLLELLAPDATVRADAAAIRAGTPERMDGRDQLAGFFNGSAQAALPVYVGDQPGSAWFHKGRAMVVFDFTVVGGRVQGITFRAEPETLERVVRRDGEARRT
ncbi:sigma-70 family RNA polymerase sigma factor [Nocardioides sp. JQ2195]|uniref:sigma-70 family RNA polymerase sigma factor n=1 Tax=Nocardioides sp. JQ2195 TaxID=2592334 RepID=UPI00143E92DA|nr:sigma-70 family RNA polymerase sigma factor [Nocardioides sp. JQ2195]QIX28457.1 sigma-70 family RNA polymerase sigma factor [Nocardioides sp. JQ2195]